MDIKREFEPSIHSSSVLSFYDLLKENEAFKEFDDLDHFLQFMENRSAEIAKTKDACLLALISQIQKTDTSHPGLCLLTYILSPGLQHILRDMVCRGRLITEAWSDLWWHFFRRVQNYPIKQRPNKVAANLLLDTRHSLMVARKSNHIYVSQVEPEELEDESQTSDLHPFWERANLLISGDDPSGLSEVDAILILGSRVYGEKLKDVAKRLRISYGAARKRRNRAERKLKEYWIKLERENERYLK